jgi:dienelactone hydrolase
VRPAAAPTPFDYDASRPLAVRDAGRANKDYPIVLRDVSFASPGGRVQGFLALPPGKARRPGVVFVHGSGGDRGQLLVQAMWLAGRGSVTLAITAPSATAPPGTSQGLTPVQGLRRQRDLAIRDVVAVRRAVDLLRSRPEVDGTRLGYVGWSAGARTGALVAGVERRIGAFVLMSGGATPVSAYAAQAPAELRDDVHRLLGPVDPLRTIGRARPGTLLLQDGRQDTVVPRAALEDLAAEPSGLYEVSWRAAQAAGALEVVRHDGPFVDCGTPEQYLRANLLASGGQSVVEDGARVDGTLDECVVWSDAEVHASESLHRAIRIRGRITVLVR